MHGTTVAVATAPRIGATAGKTCGIVARIAAIGGADAAPPCVQENGEGRPSPSHDPRTLLLQRERRRLSANAVRPRPTSESEKGSGTARKPRISPPGNVELWMLK